MMGTLVNYSVSCVTIYFKK